MVAEALQGLFLAHRPALARFLRARCGAAADIDDLLQDLWVKLAEIDALPADGVSYLYRMADHLAIDRHRSAQRRERRDDAWSELARGEGQSSIEPSAERVVIAKSELEHVAAAFDELGPRTTSIFRSYRIDGIGQRDIAAEHGISVSAVEKHLQRAYKAVLQLRYKLDAETGEADRLTDEKAEKPT